jgi:hypothetical protein
MTSLGSVDCLGDIASFAFLLACVRFYSGDVAKALSRSDAEPLRLRYRISLVRNSVMRIFVKRGLTVSERRKRER